MKIRRAFFHKRKFHKPQYKSPIWHWGIDKILGVMYSPKQTVYCPRLCITRNRYSLKAFCGFDPDRNRFIVRSNDEIGFPGVGWRKEVYK